MKLEELENELEKLFDEYENKDKINSLLELIRVLSQTVELFLKFIKDGSLKKLSIEDREDVLDTLIGALQEKDRVRQELNKLGYKECCK